MPPDHVPGGVKRQRDKDQAEHVSVEHGGEETAGDRPEHRRDLKEHGESHVCKPLAKIHVGSRRRRRDDGDKACRDRDPERDSQYDGEKRHKKDSSADSKHRADESGGKPHSADGKKQVRVRRYAPLPVMCNSMVPLVPWHEKGTEYRSANWRSPGQARPCG